MKGDLLPLVLGELVFSDGTHPDLTNHTVRFYMKDDDGVVLIDGHAAEIVDQATAKVKYTWQAGETDLVGPCHAEFKIFNLEGISQTFPAEDSFIIRFRETN